MTKLKKRLKACEVFNARMEKTNRPYRLVSFSDGSFGIDEKDDCLYEIEIKDVDMAVRVAWAWVEGAEWIKTVMLFAGHFAEDEEQHAAAVREATFHMAREKEDGRKHH